MENWAVKLSVLAAIILLTWLASYLASRVVKRIMSDENGLIPSGTIFVNIVRTGIWVIGGSIALSTCFNVDVNAIIATLGVGGIALTLGFQDALSNIFGGLVITLSKSVKTGDWVEVLGQRGKIEDINWRETVLVDVDGKQHLIPNSLMNKNSLIRLGEEGEIKITVALPTDTDLETFRTAACSAVDKALADVLAPGTKTRISYNGSTDYGLECIIWSHVMHDKLTPSRARDAMTCAVAPLLKELGPTEKW